MDLFLTLFYKTLPLYGYIALGLIFVRFVRLDLKKWTNYFLLFILTPFIFLAFLKVPLGWSSVFLPILSFGLLGLVSITAYHVSHQLYSDKKMPALVGLGASSGNNGMFGIPVVGLLLGGQAASMFALMVIGSAFSFNTIGVYLASTAQDEKSMSPIKRLLSFPLFYGVFFGVLLNPVYDTSFFNVDGLEFIFKNLSVAFSMMLIGMIIGQKLKQKETLGFDGMYLSIAFGFRFLVWPFLAFVTILIDYYCLNLLDMSLRLLLILFSIMPLPMMTAAYSLVLGLDQGKAVLSVLFSTLISLVLIPIVIFLFNLV